MSARTVTPRTVSLVGATLLLLWLLSWWLSYLPLGAWSVPIALGIAALKAVLVALFFMELVREPASFVLALVAAVSLIAVFVALTVADVVTRRHVPIVPALEPGDGVDLP